MRNVLDNLTQTQRTIDEQISALQGTLVLSRKMCIRDRVDTYKEGTNPPSFDKQFVRDWLEQSGWNKQPPAPKVPKEVIEKTVAKYQEALDLLTK